QSEQTPEVSRQHEWGHREGFQDIHVSLMGGYQLALSTQLSFQVRVQAGLTELARSGYFDRDITTRNHQLRLSLRYELFRF
ncbi:MAG: hypothetical protein AAGB22_14015, partial [Bacteroidota bacterium]